MGKNGCLMYAHHTQLCSAHARSETDPAPGYIFLKSTYDDAQDKNAKASHPTFAGDTPDVVALHQVYKWSRETVSLRQDTQSVIQ